MVVLGSGWGVYIFYKLAVIAIISLIALSTIEGAELA